MEVSETIAHHILDHDFGVMLGTLHLPITAHTLTMFGISLVLLFVCILMSRTGKSVFMRLMHTLGEEYVAFMRDGIVVPGMGAEGKQFLSYFCTLFLFILFSNLAGLIPQMKTITSNIAVTGALALCSGALIVYCGIKFHGGWGFVKTFVPGGTPWWLVPLIFLRTRAWRILRSALRSRVLNICVHSPFDYLPVLPSLRRITSSSYLMPLPR